MMKKVLLVIMMFTWISIGADYIRELEMAFHKDPYDPENVYNFAKNICLLNDERCESAIAYAIALDPDLVGEAIIFLKELGYDINPEALKNMAFKQILITLENEKRIYSLERIKIPEKEISQIILNKPPFIYFKNPWIGRRITFEDLDLID